MRLLKKIACWSLLGPSLCFTGLGFAQYQSNEALLRKAENRGSLRVVLTLNTDFVPEGRLPGPAAVGRQRAAIASAQGRIIGTLNSTLSRVTRRFGTVPHLGLEVSAEELADLLGSDDVAAVEEDVPVPPVMSSSNAVIGSPVAWSNGFTGVGQAVAILDTGVDKTHPFFSTGANKVVSEACYSSNYNAGGMESLSVCPGGASSSTAPNSGIDCVAAAEGYPSAQQDCRHGTHVAGSAAGNNGSGPHYGVARDADIIAIQIFSVFPSYCNGSDCALTWSSDQVAALERVYALRGTYHIAAVNMSIGGGGSTSPCDTASQKSAIDNLRSVGIATVVAAGNNGYKNAISSPACISSAVSVGATEDDDDVAYFSNVASFLDVFAPGVSITSSVPGGGTGTWQGTSMATPHVAGAWAVMKQANPSGSVADILDTLKTTGVPVDDQRSGGTVTGIPRIDIAQAVGGIGTSTVQFDSTFYTVEENAGSATVEVVRSGSSAGQVSATYATADGTATAGVDYGAEGGTLNWGDGETGAKPIVIALSDDGAVEPDENFTVTLFSPPSGADLGPNTVTAVTILDNDAVPPATPTIASVQDNQDGSATISWLDVESETGYEVQREKKHKKRSSWSGLTTAGSAGADETALVDASGTGTFRWRVRSVNDAGASDWSAWSQATVTDGGGGGEDPGPKPCRGRKCG